MSSLTLPSEAIPKPKSVSGRDDVSFSKSVYLKLRNPRLEATHEPSRMEMPNVAALPLEVEPAAASPETPSPRPSRSESR